MKTVITYGTFDLFHEGHYNILKRAKEYGDYLIVGVTGERYDIERGKLSVKDSLAQRIENVKKTGFADLIIVEEYLGQKISDIIRYNVDVFVIGDDWKGKFDHISNYCQVVYLERTKGVSSTQIREENFRKYSVGIITDKVDDNQIVKEAKLVSSFDVESVFSESREVLSAFQSKYEIENAFESRDKIYADSDIIFVRCALEKRYGYVKEALNEGKHVICDYPFTLDPSTTEELIRLAKQKHLLLMPNIKMIYSQVFFQFLWYAQSGLIGDIIDFSCAVSKKDRNVKYLFYELAAMALCPMIKAMGHDYSEADYRLIEEDDVVEFGALSFNYPTGQAKISVGDKIRVENHIEIIGTKGSLRMEDEWWHAKQFTYESVGSEEPQTCNINFTGNGFRFLIKEMMNLLKNGHDESKTMTAADNIKIVEILEDINKKIKEV